MSAVQPSLVLRSGTAAYDNLGVQARMDSVVDTYANNPRGFTKAWCGALSHGVVGKETLDGDFKQSMFVLPPNLRELAIADAALISAELAATPKGSAAARALTYELHTAQTLAGVANASAATSATSARGADATVYFTRLDDVGSQWARAVSGQHVWGVLLEQMSLTHHARLVALDPSGHDFQGVSAVAAGRMASEARAAEAHAAAEARVLDGNNASAIVASFTHGTLKHPRGLTEGQFAAVVDILAERIASGAEHDVGRCLTNFRQTAHHKAGFWADAKTEESFRRGGWQGKLRDACAARGLEYSRYNGIYDDSWHS